MEKQPFFSIILPTYNRANLLPNAVNSVIEQSFNDWELIIVDDGSTDKTSECFENINDRRIQYHTIKHAGRGAARNFGLDKAKGTWICFLDSDDKYLTNHLSSLHSAIIQHPLYSVFRSGIEYQVGKSIIKQAYFSGTLREEQIIYLWNYYFPLLNICIHKSLAKTYKFSAFEIWEDKEYLQKILLHKPFYQLQDYTVYIPAHEARSILYIYKNNKLLHQHLEAMEQGYSYLKKNESKIADRINLNLMKSKAIFNYAIQARRNRSFKRFFEISKKALIYSPSFRMFLKILKYTIFK